MLRRLRKLDTRKIVALTISGAMLGMLSGCGGEEVTVTTVLGDTGRPMIDDGQPTPPYIVSVLGREFRTIHLEMTDEVSTLVEPGGLEVDTGTVIAHDYLRAKVVCPGIPPRGNQCSTEEIVIDGVLYQNKGRTGTGTFLEGTDLSIDKHVAYLGPWLEEVKIYNGIAMFRGDARVGAREILGGRQLYSVFLFSSLPAGFLPRHQTYSIAFGELYEGGKPPAGSAAWHGVMIGRTTRDVGRQVEVAGKSMLEYDFSDHSIDLTLSEIAALRGGSYTGSTMFEWKDLPYNDDGSFYMVGHGNHNKGNDPHPTLGYVDGDFYGPNAEEFAGVFERDRVIGAFGGCRGEGCRIAESVVFDPTSRLGN